MRLFRFLYHEFVVFLLCIVVLYGVSYGAIRTNYAAAPQDRYYWGNEEYPLDQLGDLAYVRLGYNGHTRIFVQISSTLKDQESLLKGEYLIIGYIARLFHVDPLTMFYIARLFCSLFYLFAIYFFIVKVFQRRHERIIAIILALFSTSIVVPGWDNIFTKSVVNDVLVFQRSTTAAPHYMIGGGSLLLSLWFLSNVLDRPNNVRAFVLSAVFGLISSYVYAPGVVVVFLTVPLVFGVKILRAVVHKQNKRFIVSWIGILSAYGLIIAMPMLYLSFIRVAHGKEFAATNNFEQLNPFKIPLPQYLLGIGLSYAFAVIAIPHILAKGNTLFLLLGSWIVMHPVGEYVVSQLIGINRIRMFLTPYTAIFGMIATIGICAVGNWLKERNKHLMPLVMVALTASIVASSYYAYKESEARFGVCFCYTWGFDYSYPKKDLMDAIWWIGDHTTENDIVLSDTFAGNLIPAFAGNRVYTSWWYRLSRDHKFNEIMYLVLQFYTNTMSNQEANDFLTHNNIAYVLYGEYERSINATRADLNYPSLQKMFTSGNAIVYKVIK